MILTKSAYFVRIFITVALSAVLSACTGEKQSSRNIAELHDRTVISAPGWARKGVLYKISPGTFTRQGTFAAIEGKLDYLQALGVNIFWLTSIFPTKNDQGNDVVTNPYAVEDFRSLNLHYGNAQDLRQLVRAVHQHKMKVILGVIPAYAASNNVLEQEHPDWFLKNTKGDLISEQETGNNISWFNYDNSTLRHYMIETLLYWVREYDIDGYASTITGTVPLDFWNVCLAALRAVKSDIFMVAQGEDPQLLLAGFNSIHGRMEYEELIAIHSCRSRTAGIVNLILENQQSLPHNGLVLHYLENDDTPRSMSTFGVGAIQAYASLLFTLPGLPLLIAGQEIGEIEKHSPAEKSFINWQQTDSTLMDMYRGLIKLRSSWSCFTSGAYIQLPTASLSGSVGAFPQLGQDSAAIILTNLKNRSAQKVLITLPEGLPTKLTQYRWTGYGQAETSFDINYMYFPELLPYSTRIFLGLNKKRGI